MNIQEEFRIGGHQPVVGYVGDEIDELFEHVIQRCGKHNVYYICSWAYNFGKIHGKHEERARRKRGATA